MNLKNKKLNIIFQLLILVAVFALGLLINSDNLFCNSNNLKHINPDIICESNHAIKKYSYIKTRNDIEDYILKKKQEEIVTDVSIYFRDLQNGPTMGIKEHELFSPASLLKIPLLLTYHNLANEDNNGLLDRNITITNSQDALVQIVTPKDYAKQGNTYSIRQLLEFTIMYSDNNSYYTLLDYLNQVSPKRDLLKDTFVDLGIIDPKDYLDNTISVKSYGSIFVQLYHSSYFNKKEISEEALSLLSRVDYKEGLVAGIPRGIEVAHKFGERSNPVTGLDQLHDCGIIYYPRNPYLLCIMTRGSDFTKLPEVISYISRMVYEEVDSRKL